VDLLVEFEPHAHVGLFEFIRLKNELSDLLACEVDLATPNALHKAMRDDILREAIRAA
jgi:predicted nucleotidyltransferase